jgi:hypothetical protein
VKLSDLPGNARAFVCKHVFEGVREVRYVAFSNDVLVSCHEPDHDEWGKGQVQVQVGQLREQFLPGNAAELESGFEMTMDNNRLWHVGPVWPGPRVMAGPDLLRLVTDKVRSSRSEPQK